MPQPYAPVPGSGGAEAHSGRARGLALSITSAASGGRGATFGASRSCRVASATEERVKRERSA